MSLITGDLKGLVSHLFEIDRYSSKMGDDCDIVVLSFSTDGKDAGEDLVDFIEKGFKFVLDADLSPGELENGKYRVFVEIERTRRIYQNIKTMLYGISKLTSIKEFRFRYHKSFNSMPATDENIQKHVPATAAEYNLKKSKNLLENYDSFFYDSNLDTIVMEGDLLLMGRKNMKSLSFMVESYDDEVLVESLDYREMYDQSSVAETISLTRYIGEYDITKCGNKYIFENAGKYLVLSKIDYEVLNDS